MQAGERTRFSDAETFDSLDIWPSCHAQFLYLHQSFTVISKHFGHIRVCY